MVNFYVHYQEYRIISGALKQLSYVRALGSDAIILSPLIPRSSDCSKPGTTGFSDIDPRYGTLDDFTNVVAKANKLGKKFLHNITPIIPLGLGRGVPKSTATFRQLRC